MSAEEVSLDALRAKLVAAELELEEATDRLSHARRQETHARNQVNSVRRQIAEETTKLLVRPMAGADRYATERVRPLGEAAS